MALFFTLVTDFMGIRKHVSLAVCLQQAYFFGTESIVSAVDEFGQFYFPFYFG